MGIGVEGLADVIGQERKIDVEARAEQDRVKDVRTAVAEVYGLSVDGGHPWFDFDAALGHQRKEEPELERWPGLARPLLFGPLTPTSFRMSGRDSLADAPQRFAAEVQAFGCMPTNELEPAQVGQLQALAEARGDEAFSRFVAALVPHATR